LIGGINALGFLVDSVITSTSLRQAIMDVLLQPLEVDSMRAWTDFVFREAVYMVAGEEILELPGHGDEDEARDSDLFMDSEHRGRE
jgi:hypothetical protein